MTPNIAHQSGHFRAYIETAPFHQKSTLYVFNEDSVVTIGNGGVSFETMPPEAQHLDTKHTFIEWSNHFEDDIVDMWKAVGKALDVYSDEPGKAYKQGLAEGEAKVLREWNESLRGQAK